MDEGHVIWSKAPEDPLNRPGGEIILSNAVPEVENGLWNYDFTHEWKQINRTDQSVLHAWWAWGNEYILHDMLTRNYFLFLVSIRTNRHWNVGHFIRVKCKCPVRESAVSCSNSSWITNQSKQMKGCRHSNQFCLMFTLFIPGTMFKVSHYLQWLY